MLSSNVAFLCLLGATFIGAVQRTDYGSDGFDFSGFQPSSSFQRTENQLAEPSARVDKNREDKDSQAERTQRFGISAYGTTGSQGGYGASAPGLYGPLKIDLGGVLLGSILGFGAIVILPKIIHALSYGYGGGYGRSLEADWSQVTEALSKFDDALSRNHIDSGACAQRLACSYVQLANENVVTGNATELDALLASLTDNTLVRRMFDGTPILEAISSGKSLDSDCQQLYSKCKLDKKTVVKLLTQMIPS